MSEEYVAHVIDEVQVLSEMVDALIATVGEGVVLVGEAAGAAVAGAGNTDAQDGTDGEGK